YQKRVLVEPDFMQKLTAKAKVALRNKWQDPEYTQTIIRSKIAGFVTKLLSTHETVTPEIYEHERTNNGIPRINHALTYFSDFDEIVQRAKLHNHKVVRVEFLSQREDVYDLTIEDTHNFALADGIFVHNSIDGDSAGAQRYTEARMTRIAEEMLRDIEKDTVEFRDNYDATRKEPTVLPAAIPNLLLNGTIGIAVGMATNIPPHNLTEVVDALVHLSDHPHASAEDIIEFIHGPDFPTGGFIYDQKQIREAYASGRGAILTRGKAEIEEMSKGKGYQIVITEIPYQVNKAEMIEHMAMLVQEKKLEGIRDMRDESDKEGLRVVIELKTDAQPQKVLNNLYRRTELEKSFHLNMLALVDGIQPQVMSIKSVLEEFLRHRFSVITRRTQFDLARARERIHILEGLKIALDHIDRVIETIKKSRDREDARIHLIKKFDLSEIQANAILDMRLATLAGLERQKIEDELKEKQALAKSLEALLKDSQKIKNLVKTELLEIKERHGDERKTKVVKSSPKEFSDEDLIADEEVMIMLTRGGYVKRIKPEWYRIQKRGGKGLIGMETKEEDVVEHLLSARTHSSLLFFTDSGKVYQILTYEVPEGTRTSKGRPIVNFLSLGQEERVTSILGIAKGSGKKSNPDQSKQYIVMVTKDGIIKKADAESFENVRRNGLIAMTLAKTDALRFAKLTGGKDEIILLTKRGQAIRFSEKDVREMGRQAAGVRAIRLGKGDEVVGMDIVESQKSNVKSQKLLVIMENGFGKQTLLKEYKKQRRGGSGIKTAKITAKTGNVVSGNIVDEEGEELIAISQKGQVIRTTLAAIAVLSRLTQGVRIMKLDEGDAIASITTF
ncbi:MAG: DNA gyrase subunit A, partial [Parcubacteria group bacterium Gr01-1014_33]